TPTPPHRRPTLFPYTTLFRSASEDFSDIPNALGTPYTYWGIGGIGADKYARARAAGRVEQDIPVNHSEFFAPVIEPTLSTGTQRSEEHTSELQSRFDLVCRLL